ncbi:MAG: type II toxin-antitoxin system RelE/ParE family toxin [Acidobacteria bacterium]|nr:type II toxin-antitoxin system RelE/ParE family toxin [Acidobacteriota bacterium]
MRVRLVSKVYSDIESAMSFYLLEAGTEIATEFYDEFKRCRQIIAERPMSYPIVRNEIRRINLRRFPYHVLYQIVGDGLVKVLAVKHDRRDPDFGLDR